MSPEEYGVLQHLRKQLSERKSDISESVSHGNCADFAEYKHLCGQIQGLAYALRELDDLADKLERSR